MSWMNRRWLRHDRPSWVDHHDPVFITFCGRPKGLNQFAKSEVWPYLVAAVEHLNLHHGCEALLFLAMPDHLHLLVRIPASYGIRAYIRRFKYAVSVACKITWQSGAFDHRLRGKHGVQTKWDYVLKNPVRANLASQPDDWPYWQKWPKEGGNG